MALMQGGVMRSLLLSLILLTPPALACPTGPDFSDARDALLADLSVAQDEIAARDVQSQIWKLWFTAPDQRAQNWLEKERESP